MKHRSERVDAIFMECLFHDEWIGSDDVVVVEGVYGHTYGFNLKRLQLHDREIRELLNEQWGSVNMEKLCVLAIATLRLQIRVR